MLELVLDWPWIILSMIIRSKSLVVEVRWVLSRNSLAFCGVANSSLIPRMSSAAYWSPASDMGLGGQAVRTGVSVDMTVFAPWTSNPIAGQGIHAVFVFILSGFVAVVFRQGAELASPSGA